MKHYKLIACKVLQREFASVAALCPNFIDITFMRQELHQAPVRLQEALQAEIDSVESGADNHTSMYSSADSAAMGMTVEKGRKLDAILMGYGLCSNAVLGLKARNVPLVFPRGHDCTTLMMGSKEAYMDYFTNTPGTSYLSLGWMDVGSDSVGQDLEKLRQEYMEKYDDEDTVEYLMEFARDSMKNYKSLTAIFWPGFPREKLEEQGQARAAEKGWEFLRYEGKPSLVERFLSGDWDPEDFLVVQPGEMVAAAYDGSIIKAVSTE